MHNSETGPIDRSLRVLVLDPAAEKILGHAATAGVGSSAVCVERLDAPSGLARIGRGEGGYDIAVLAEDATQTVDADQLFLMARLSGCRTLAVLSDAASVDDGVHAGAAAAGLLPVTIAGGAGTDIWQALAAAAGPPPDAETPLRLAVDRARDGGPGCFTGLVVSGELKRGQAIVFLPSGETAAVTRISAADRDVSRVGRGARVEVAVVEPIHPGAATIAAAADDRPEMADQIAASVVWLSQKPLLPGRDYRVNAAQGTLAGRVTALKHRIKAETLEPVAARRLEAGEAGLCNIAFSAPLVFDPAERGTGLGRFVLADKITGEPSGIGFVRFGLRRAANVHWQAVSIDKGQRAAIKGQKPCCLWLTGLSGAGKSTIANLLERRLVAEGRHTYLLDGDNVRHGLNRDLGFTDADRVENIRRVAEVAKLMVDAGLIVISAFISPFRAERRMAREMLGPDQFIEVFVDSPLAVCEARDRKGLYRKARAGLIQNFTGISSPYEPPEHAEVHLDTGKGSAEDMVEIIVAALAARGITQAGAVP